MDGARWKDVERVLDVALDSDPETWPAILDQQCGSDPELRREVEALLARHATAQRFLPVPPAGAVAALVAEAGTDRTREDERRIGLVLAGRYRLVRELGRGGMATVYLAEDVRHRRDVALKVLTPDLAAAFKRGRFLREIEIAARLTHPHILPVHDSGETDGLLFYVMPYVAGETLRARLAREGELLVSDAVVILRDVAEALAYAHGRGVVHRDVKPDNVMLAGRHALVADFGVAKAIHEATAGLGTVTGAVSLGTPAYMAPEQAVADPELDHRADLYALGVVAYEILTGRLPFAGRTGRELLAAHVTEEPEPLERFRDDLSPELSRLVMKCLRKRPADRWQSADEIVRRLETFATPGSGTAPARLPRVRVRRRDLLVGSAAAAALITLITLGTWLAPRLRPRSAVASLPTSRQVTFTGDLYRAALSPNGRYVAMARGPEGRSRAFLQEATEGRRDNDAMPIAAGTAVTEVAWSGDGSEILLRTLDSLGRFAGYARASLVGRAVRALHGSGTYQRVSPDGAWVVGWSPSSKEVTLRAVPSGDSIRIRVPGDYTWLRHVTWSSESRHLVVHVQTNEGGLSRLLVIDPAAARPPRELLRDSVRILSPVWSPRGDAIYYLRQRLGAWDLWKVGVSPATGQLTRAPVLVVPALESTSYFAGDAFSISGDARRLMYVRLHIRANLLLLAEDSAGRTYRRVRDLTTGTSLRSPPAVSPDGKWVAFTDGDQARRDVYIMPLGGGPPTRLTTQGTALYSVAWSPAGDRVAFTSWESGRVTVGWVSTDGAASRRYPEAQGTIENNALVWHPSPEILYRRESRRNWHRLDPATGAEAPLLASDSLARIYDAAVAPDGETIAIGWTRQSPGIGIVARAGGAARSLIGGEYDRVMGWEPDGAALRVYGERSRHAIRVAPSGRVLGAAPSLPDECPGRPAIVDARRIICQHMTYESDVWIVDDFDPEVRRQRRN